jgi:hypothetical protein
MIFRPTSGNGMEMAQIVSRLVKRQKQRAYFDFPNLQRGMSVWKMRGIH